MNTVFPKVASIVLACAVSACGGGGGDGGSAAAPSSSPAPVATPAPLTLSVFVNGAARAADSSGRVAVNPGDTVRIAASETVGFTSAAAAGTAVSARRPAIAGTSWSALLLNGKASAGSLTVTGSAARGVSAGVTLVVAAGDARNGSYTVFAANGTRQSLALDFNGLVYDMTDAANATDSGTLAVDSEPGTYRFVSARNAAAAANTARLRLTTDTVVGSFAFATAYATPVAYSVQPFVASRALLTSPSALDGIYNRLSIRIAAASRDSLISQIRVRNAGTLVDVCNDAVVYTVAACPTTSLRTYAVTAATAPGIWNTVNVADATDTASFAIASVGGQNLYLDASTVATASVPTVQFRVGTLDLAFANATVRGSSTAGAWGSSTVTPATFDSTGVLPDGSTVTASLSLVGAGTSGPAFLRVAQAASNGGNGYWLAQGAGIGVMVGARSNPATQGFLQLGLID